MKVTIIQTKLFWEDREKNIEHFNHLLSKINEPTDLIVLPEMFTTGFSMHPEKIAEEHLGLTFNWLTTKAKEKKAVITGSVAIKYNHQFYNRLHWVEPNGNSSFYDKRHLFRMAKEDEKYTPGKEKIINQISDMTIMPLICYDLRFPVWARNFKKQKPIYDVLIYVANWPEIRSYQWKQLLIARAIENQCFVIGVNRIGIDGNNVNHSGDSLIINPRGEIINNPKSNEESIETITLNKNYLNDFRKIFPVGLDADEFDII